MSIINRLHTDPRVQPGAYVVKGPYLFEVISLVNGKLELENVATDHRHTVPVADAVKELKLVRRSPAVPDYLAA